MWKAFASRNLGRAALVLPCALLSVSICEGSDRVQTGSKLEFDSSDARLVEAFDWAKAQALAYVFEGDPVGPWYEAALPGREAFCMRDVAHQAMGAHALGLAPQNLNMLRRFAENISESRDWCSFWEINRHNRPAPVDYKNNREFWYCLPANYDVLDACYRMYLWTGNPAYINDPVFLNFYERTVNDYEQRWSLDRAHVMKRGRWMNIHGEFDAKNPLEFFRGNPSYDELHEPFVLGIDLLATQYAGYLAYAGIQQARQNKAGGREYLDKAVELKRLMNNTWWDDQDQRFYARLNEHHQFEGRQISAVLYRNAADGGLKLQRTLDALVEQIKAVPSPAVEDESHNPEILYRYGRPDLAYSQILDLTRKDRARREYPEVSYSVVGSIAVGLMGITVDSATRDGVHAIRTLPSLGKFEWAELRNLPVRGNEITVHHEGRTTRLTNQRGPALIWRAAFHGFSANLNIDGKLEKAQHGQAISEEVISFLEVPLAQGATAAVRSPD